MNLEQERPQSEGRRPDVSARFGEAPGQPAQPPADPPAPLPAAPVAPPPAPHDPEAEAAAVALRAQRAAMMESGIALDTGEEGQPFLRCGVCEADNYRNAERCQSCRSRLDTDEQRAFNRGFWAQRRAQEAQERAAEEERKRVRRAALAEGPDTSRMELAGTLARAVEARERQRLAWMESAPDSVRGSLGLQLLSRIKDPDLQKLSLLAAGAGWLWLGARAFFHAGAEAHPVSMVLFFALPLLFLPRGARRP
jgi:hypothetical protein